MTQSRSYSPSRTSLSVSEKAESGKRVLEEGAVMTANASPGFLGPMPIGRLEKELEKENETDKVNVAIPPEMKPT